ncbi:mannitol dehydrogenase putative [Basidiobolus meristosporus CBS 931.73]|uniref:Mannitol dehydrogenase putative n=1 Tax=Basidiobolus meristosporus CBS 931.73 TaxID=1314790 RepID=A0A1Y1XUH4_9FUNG|nr:mannitol dehydrogenase putative [Basidiobolus meristosporus CBS 931.73]|eukprot:ORX88934.1 mannitol dehydrogenase putative [Basidiobolus meristosporus CBS 931.73]
MLSNNETQFDCYACHGKDQALQPWAYTPRPLGEDDVEIAISHCGICGSDIHTLDSGWGATKYPVVVGHEIIGKVVDKGPRVSGLEIGDRVGVGPQVFACLKSDCKACSTGNDATCTKYVGAYNGTYADGAKSYGGYSKGVRVLSHYAFKIPDVIDSAEAAPILCAGVTVFTPMRRHGVKEGHRVGVVGIGGLGHLALQYAKALGAEVTAISTSTNKKAEAHKLGATHFVNLRDDADMKAASRSLDYLFITSNATDAPYDKYASLLDVFGKIILLAAPEDNIKISPFSLIPKNITLAGSIIGSIEDQKATLEFSAKHNIRPIIEKLPMEKVNEGLQHVRDGKVRYRVVLEN